MRRLILTLHLTVALVAGLLILTLGVTGSIMAFEPELQHALNPGLSYVTPTGSPKPLAELGAAAAAAAGDTRITGYGLPNAPNLSYVVQLRGKSVYIDQYTARVLGIRAPEPDFLSKVHQWHLRLNWRDPTDRGKTIVKWSGVAMLFLLVSGLYLWWPTRRFRMPRAAGAKRFWFDLHNVTGVYSIVFLLIAAITGVVIGFDDITTPGLYSMTHSAPLAVYGKPPAFKPAPGTVSTIDPDAAAAIVRSALPGAEPAFVNVPPPGGMYAISARYPEDLTPGGRSRVFIDSSNGHVLLAEGSRDAPAGTRLVTLNRALHTGDVFGMPSKIVMSLASASVVLQLATGLLWWWQKRRSRSRAGLSNPPPLSSTPR